VRKVKGGNGRTPTLEVPRSMSESLKKKGMGTLLGLIGKERGNRQRHEKQDKMFVNTRGKKKRKKKRGGRQKVDSSPWKGQKTNEGGGQTPRSAFCL